MTTLAGKTHLSQGIREAIAILAGDGLLTEAFRLMANRPAIDHSSCDDAVVLDLINEVAHAAGVLGMVGGQVVDIESEGKAVDLPTLQYIHTHKTGAMILASVRVGAKLGGAKKPILKALTRYGESLGLAFQIADDCPECRRTGRLNGQTGRKRPGQGKSHLSFRVGSRGVEIRSRELVEMAGEALKSLGPEADPLREIARFVIAREY